MPQTQNHTEVKLTFNIRFFFQSEFYTHVKLVQSLFFVDR